MCGPWLCFDHYRRPDGGSPNGTRPLMELYLRYERGKFGFPHAWRRDPCGSKMLGEGAGGVANGLHESLSREARDELRETLAGDPSELRLKIKHQSDPGVDATPVSLPKAAEERRAYWGIRGEPLRIKGTAASQARTNRSCRGFRTQSGVDFSRGMCGKPRRTLPMYI